MKCRPRSGWWISVLMLGGGVLIGRSLLSPAAPPVLATSQDSGLSIQRIQSLSELTTLKVDVADAQVTQLQGRTGSIKAVLVIKGDLTVGVDLSAARFEQVDRQTHTAVLVLPEPAVQSVRLDHEKTKLIGVWPTGLWEIVPGGEDADAATVNLAYRDAQRQVQTAAQDPQVVQRARRQAEQVLAAIFGALGWEVRVRWDR